MNAFRHSSGVFESVEFGTGSWHSFASPVRPSLPHLLAALGALMAAAPAASGATAVAAGYNHSFFINADGSLWAMGSNLYGNLGDGTTADHVSPVQVATDVATVAAGFRHSLFSKNDGRLWAMGENDYGQLGDGTTTTRYSPVQVATGVVAVAAAEYHNMFVKTDGSLWGMGYNYAGQLGDGTTTTRYSPVQVATGVAAAAARGYNSVFVKTDGSLWGMGLNQSGQLGDGTTTTRISPVQMATGVAAVAAGGYYNLFVKTDGSLWATGSNVYGQLGDGTRTDRLNPVQVATGVRAVTAGNVHSLFIKTDGSLWAMGYNTYGQLGDGTTADRVSPVQVATGVRVAAAGSLNSFFIKTDGSLWAMGYNTYGQLGDGTTTNRLPPVQVLTSGAVAPSIITQPASQTVNAGATATFSVVASGTPAPTYQWKRSGTDIAGATNATLTLTNLQTSNAGNYTVVVTNGGGSVTSSAAVLTVNAPPTITTQPQAQGVVVGASATFTVVATGTPALTYQWQKGGTAIVGATSATLTLTNVQAADAGTYAVVITNTTGSVTSSNATLTVTAAVVAPAITTQPASQAVTTGANVTLTVVVSGTTPTYQWKKGGTDISGATSASLALSSVQSTDAASYTVVVANSAGSVTSNAAVLTVNAAPAITTQPQSQSVIAGANATFTVVATGTPAPTYQWQKGGTAISGATSATLALTNVQAGDAAIYAVLISNSAGSVTSNNAALTVTAAVVAPAITTQPASQTVTAGANVALTVVASGTSPTYQWRKNGVAIGGATGATFALSNVQSGDAAGYTVVVTNSAGSATSNTATLTVNVSALPSFSAQPQSQTINAGQTATFNLAASGALPLVYQWFRNGVVLPGANGAIFSIGNVQAGDAGSYTVIVRNGAGSVTSSVATLTVNGGSAAPLVLTPPASQTITIGGTATFSVAASGLALGYQWFKNGVVITGATNATYLIANVGLANAGSYTVTITNSAGSITCDAGVLTITAGPSINTQPLGQHVDIGERVTLSVLAAATGGGAFTYQWKKNGTVIAGAIGSTFTIPNVLFDDMGFYSVAVGSGANLTEANAAVLTVATGGSARPVNISTRAVVPANGDLTPGFVITGAANKTVLVRAVGPGLIQFGVPDVLADPQLAVIPLGSSTVVASNNDWGSNTNLAALNAATTSSGAFALPANSRDAATVAILAPGPYTVRVTGAGSSSGVALVEVYDTEPATTTSRFVNISARAFVGMGANILVPGFVVAGDSARLLLIRAIGPGLVQFGVTDVLADPQLNVIPLGKDFSVVGNDNWGGTTALKAAFGTAGAFSIPDNSRDAAVLLRLPPGGYTVQVSGVADTTGVALVEVYDLGP